MLLLLWLQPYQIKMLKADKITVGGPEILLVMKLLKYFQKLLEEKITFQSLEPNTFARKMSKIVTGSEEYEKPSIYGGMAAFYRWYNEQDPFHFSNRNE